MGSAWWHIERVLEMSIAEWKLGDLREVRLRAEAMRKMWTSVGMMSWEGERTLQPPGSTSMLRTIHLKYKKEKA